MRPNIRFFASLRMTVWAGLMALIAAGCQKEMPGLAGHDGEIRETMRFCIFNTNFYRCHQAYGMDGNLCCTDLRQHQRLFKLA